MNRNHGKLNTRISGSSQEQTGRTNCGRDPQYPKAFPPDGTLTAANAHRTLSITAQNSEHCSLLYMDLHFNSFQTAPRMQSGS